MKNVLKRKLEEGYDLPHDVILEIFSHLPAKQICKFRCTNKFLNGLTSTGKFALKQSSNVSKTVCGLFVEDFCRNIINNLVFLSDRDEEEDGNYDIKPCSSGIPESFLSNGGYTLAGCNNGIVVYEKWNCYGTLGQLCIINPVTLQCRTIPHPTSSSANPLRCVVMVLLEPREGHDVHYNLVCFLDTDDWGHYVDYCVFSSKENRWKEESKLKLDVGSRDLNYERPILIEETIYFVSNCFPYFKSEPYIVGVDVNREKSKILPLPVPNLISCDHRLQIANWDDDRDSSLCLIYLCSSKFVFTIWILKDRKTWTWSKTPIEITFERMGLERPKNKGEVTCFTLINDEMLVFTVGKTIHVYGLKDGKRRKLKKEVPAHTYLRLLPYANTLCPC